MHERYGFDSVGRVVDVGATVRFRGMYFTVKSFGSAGPRGYRLVYFEEPVTHTDEEPDEVNIDLVQQWGRS